MEKQPMAPPQPSGLRNTYRDVPAEVKLLPILMGEKSLGLPLWEELHRATWLLPCQ